MTGRLGTVAILAEIWGRVEGDMTQRKAEHEAVQQVVASKSMLKRIEHTVEANCRRDREKLLAGQTVSIGELDIRRSSSKNAPVLIAVGGEVVALTVPMAQRLLNAVGVAAFAAAGPNSWDAEAVERARKA